MNIPMDYRPCPVPSERFDAKVIHLNSYSSLEPGRLKSQVKPTCASEKADDLARLTYAVQLNILSAFVKEVLDFGLFTPPASRGGHPSPLTHLC